jgi:hypothetical protein
MAGINAEDLAENVLGLGKILSLHSLFCNFHCRCNFFGQRAFAAELVDELPDLALGQGTHEAINGLAIDKGKYRRDGLHAHLGGDLLVLVNIDFDEAHLAIGLFHDRRQLFAGATPGRPKINKNRNPL